MERSTLIAVVVIAAIFISTVAFVRTRNDDSGQHSRAKIVKIPRLSQAAKDGKTLFDANCAACHGKNANGTESGPPLIHKIYEPAHHSDLSFHRAAKYGVRAHHWRFGNMPPVPGITEAQVERIIAYVRETQRANGIH